MAFMRRRVAGGAVLIGFWVALVTAAALWLPHEWDWSAFKWLGSHAAPSFSQEVSIVDVAWDPSDIPGNRRKIADFLGGLVRSNQRPRAVILDITFDPCQSTPCGEPMQSARNALIESIRAATRVVPVYATEEPVVDRDDVPSGPLEPRDEQIYGALTGAAQTRFTVVPNAEGIFYRICYAGVPITDSAGDAEGSENVWAMVARVLMTPRAFANSPPCDGAHVPVRLGPKLSGVAPAVFHFTGSHAFANYAQFDSGDFVIVGTTRYDRSPFSDRSGPELLGWALSNALDQASLAGQGSYYDVQAQNAMLALLVPAFSALAVLAYVAIFFLLKRVRLGSLRPFVPWIASVAAALIGLAIFAAFEAWMFFSHHLQPQVTLIAFGIVAAAGLSGVRGNRILSDEANAIDSSPTESYDYDVFISYAHTEGAWVAQNVYGPLHEATLPNGKKLKIFFDTSSIRAGTAWQQMLALAIDGSRFIVPVYSETYFNQPYCRFEIMRAHRKWILAGEDSRCVLPVMRGHPKIYRAVDDIQALSIDDHPDLVARHIAEIVDRLSEPETHEASVS